MKLFFLLVATAVALPIPMSGRVDLNDSNMSDCDICKGVAVQVRRSPNSMVMCGSPIPSCMNITNDIVQLSMDAIFDQFTPEELCVLLDYCAEPSYIINNRMMDRLVEINMIDDL